MVVSNAIFKALASFLFVGGIVGGAWHASNTEEKEFIYAVVSAEHMVSKDKTWDLYKEDKKNYKCESDNKVDFDCEIYTLNPLESENKSIDLHFLANENSKIKQKKSIISSNNYILKINKKKYESAFESKKHIFIKSSLSRLNLESFIKLSPKFDFDTNYETISSKYLVVQTINKDQEETKTLETTKKIFCKLNDIEFGCEIKNFNSEQYIKGVNNPTFTSLTNANNLKNLTYYVLFLKQQERTIEDLKTAEIKLFNKDKDASENEAGTELARLRFDQLIIKKNPEIDSLFFIKENYKHLLVTAESEATSPPTTEMFVKNKQNYKCSFNSTNPSKTIVDNDCKIFKLIYSKTKHSASLSEIPSNYDLVTAKADLKNKEIFGLRLDATEFLDVDFSIPQKIVVDATFSSDENKKYATLTTKFEFQNKKWLGNTSLILGKPLGTTTETSYKCKVENAISDCDIYKFKASEKANSNTKSDLIFSEPTKVTTGSEIKENEFHIIDLKSKSIPLDYEEKKIEVFKSDNSTKIFYFSIDSSLIGLVEAGTIKKAITI